MKIHKKKEFLDELRRVPLISYACDKVGIARQTYYRWIEANQDFKNEVGLAMQEGADKVNDMANSQLFKSINNGELRAIIYWNEKQSDRINKMANRLQGKTENVSTEDIVKLATKNILEELHIGSTRESKFVLVNNDPRYYSPDKSKLEDDRDRRDGKVSNDFDSEGALRAFDKILGREI